MSKDGEFLRHVPCPACGSSNANAEYSSDTSYCHKCGYWARLDGETKVQTEKKPSTLLIGDFKDLPKRKIPESICRKFNYTLGVDRDGTKVHLANYYNKDGEVVGQKVRYQNKDFRFIGDNSSRLMFGQQIWGDSGRKLVITEGEIDALSYATATDGKFPVVSIGNGANAAKKEIAKHMEWVNSFEEIYLWFDNDEAGRQAVNEVCGILPASKVKIIRHPDYKDANEVLLYKAKAGITSAFYNATSYKPDDIITPTDLVESIAEPIDVGFPYAYSNLTHLLYGRRFGEVVTVGAGVSVGKTDFIMTQIAHDVNQGWKVATFMLEQSVRETILRTAGKIDGIHYHIPNTEYDKSKLQKTVQSMDGNLFLFDNFGANTWEVIREKIRYMAFNYECSIFYIDNLTALNSHAADERRNLDSLMAEVAGLAKELNIWIMLVSHLNPPKTGASHESGGKTEQNQFTGSRAIMRWSYTMLGIERNTLHEDPIERNKGLVRVLKDRFSGSATGRTVGFIYDKETGLVHETEADFEIERGDDDETNNDF